ncbi:MAG TPA: two-component system response regulator [Microscillaceae bacterium]|nr:two-component system response regulator [Microscillaceae bacterium]
MKKKILIVEDMQAVRNVIANALNEYEIVTASYGLEALKILDESPSSIDLVLSDYNMPNMSGMKLLTKIRKHANSDIADVPFIMLTTERDIKKKKKAKDAGLTDWIEKPYNYEVFKGKIRHALNKSEKVK